MSDLPNPKMTTGLTLSPAGAPVDEKPSLMTAVAAKLAGARFWTFSLLLHIVIILLVGTTVLIKQVVEPPDFEGGDGGEFVAADTNTPPPPPSAPTISNAAPSPTTAPTASVAVSPTTMTAIVTNAQSAISINALPSAVPAPKVDNVMKPSAVPMPATNAAGLTKQQAAGIRGFTQGWAKGGGRGGSLKERSFEFTAYLAKYAGGDWDSTIRMEQGKIVQGSLPNLLFVMKRLSRDKVAGDPQSVPLDLASQEIFQKKPPFIFFTGHQDFKLTDQEVKNLRDYIIVGGCIWGDSSLAGHRSRFDIAFRREMKRVIADTNKEWKQLPENHPLFTKCYFPEVKNPPPGMNFYHEPVYGLEGVGGEIGVIYTANNYGDMFQFGIDEQGNIDLSRDEKRRMIAVNEAMWHRRNLYFRNIEPKALLNCYKFGMNVVIHMMTRWEEKVGMKTSM